MPYKHERDCPICYKSNIRYISDHLRQVHDLWGDERKTWLKTAKFSTPTTTHNLPQFLADARIRSLTSVHSSKTQTKRKSHSTNLAAPQHHPKRIKTSTSVKNNNKLHDGAITVPYPEFKFRHLFSLLCIAPSQAGKTYLIRQILEENRIQFPDPKKKVRFRWHYGQFQGIYSDMQRTLGNRIKFIPGLPKYKDDLSDIDSNYNNIIILDDLMDVAKDSPIVAKLFTQGRHRNASVMLLLQNAFPKGKYNTDVSRNAQYVIVFGSPSDRKQVGMLSERIFDKQRNIFMDAYNKVTSEPYRYMVIDNKPDTRADRQVLTDIFGSCLAFPHINSQREIIEAVPGDADSTITSVKENTRTKTLEENWDVKWSDATIGEWSPLFRGASTEKDLPAGYRIYGLYDTAENKSTPGVSVNGFYSQWTNQCVWPVQIKHVQSGQIKYIYLGDRNEDLRRHLLEHGVKPL